MNISLIQTPPGLDKVLSTVLYSFVALVVVAVVAVVNCYCCCCCVCSQVLAVGTSTGDLLTYDIQSGSDRGELNVVARIKAHTPHSGPQDKRFGQLGKQ